MYRSLRLFAGTSNPTLAANISQRLGVELGKIKISRFQSGEVYVHFEESIRNCDVFLAVLFSPYQ